jgi:hypothetical protein
MTNATQDKIDLARERISREMESAICAGIA